jgi:hypothetical protein
MRDLTKSMLSLSWALPLFGMKQMMDMAAPRDPSRPFGRVTDSFEAVTRTAQDQLGGAWNSAFRAGDQLQRGMVDLMFSFFSPDAWNPNRMMRTTSDVMQSSMNAAGQMAGAATGAAQGAWSAAGSAASAQPSAGWGPVTAPAPAPAYVPPSSVPPSSSSSPSVSSSPVGPPPGWKVSTPNV